MMTTTDAFKLLDFRAGTIVRVEEFPEAKKPAFKVWVDLGAEMGVKKSSAQIQGNYTVEKLMHMQVICVVNLPSKQIGPFQSQILITGFKDDENEIVLAAPLTKVPNGARLH